MGFKNNDVILIEGIQEGNEYAFKIAFLKYYTQISKYILKYVRSKDLAEDIVQEVFTDLWDIRTRLDPQGHLRGLLYEMARNKALDYIKHKKIVDGYVAETKRRNRENLYRSFYQEEHEKQFLYDAINKATKDLPPKGHQIFELNRNEGLTYREISEYLDISVKTVETHMRRALKKLRQHLFKYVSSS